MRDSLTSPSGWIFADLLLGLLVVFMAVGAIGPSLIGTPTISLTAICDGESPAFELSVTGVAAGSDYELFRDGISQGNVDSRSNLSVPAQQSHEYKVRALTGSSAGPFSNVVTAVGSSTCATPLQAPSMAVTARCDSGGPVLEVTLSAVPNATRYDLYQDDSFVQSVAPGTPAIVRSLIPGRAYSLAARAANEAVQSELSAPLSATTPTGCSAAVSVNSVCRVLSAARSVRTLDAQALEDLLYNTLSDLASVPGVQAKLALVFGYSNTDVGDGLKLAAMVNQILQSSDLSTRLAQLGGSLLPPEQPLDARSNGFKRWRSDQPPHGTVAIELFLAYGGDTRAFRSDEGCVKTLL